MIKVYFGENRKQAMKDIQKYLGDDYEVVEGDSLSAADLPSTMMGNSLFSLERSILIRDFFANKALVGELPKYYDSPHKIILLESKVDKRSSIYKTLKNSVEFKEYQMPRDPNANLVFDIYKTAKRDGKKAVDMLRRIKVNQEPMMFLGLMTSLAIKDYKSRPGVKEKQALKKLAKLDMDLKSSKIEAWTLIEAFLMSLKTK